MNVLARLMTTQHPPKDDNLGKNMSTTVPNVHCDDIWRRMKMTMMTKDECIVNDHPAPPKR